MSVQLVSDCSVLAQTVSGKPHFSCISVFCICFQCNLYVLKHRAAIQHCCSIWICWLNEGGIEILVEVTDQNWAVMVMMQCIWENTATKISNVSTCNHPSSSKSSVLNCLLQHSFIHRHELQYPSGPLQELTLFSMSTVARSVMKAKSCVICNGGIFCNTHHGTWGWAQGVVERRRNQMKQQTWHCWYGST